uniref:SJCHGC02959 protein n=1 Tax=Schistosoma japonicum TaxID=6182 RepID=Q5DAV0_SCHJA|nr:SJCHGC02959 protein [Schistosoma japonicum]
MEYLESKIIEARGEFKYFDKKSIKFRKKINRKLGRKNRTINKSFLKNLISKLRIIYGEYVTDEDEENWTICIMYHEEECIKNAIEYEIEKCYELAHPYPNDFEKLGQMLVGRQVAVFDSNKFLFEYLTTLHIYRKLIALNNPREVHMQ